MSAAKLHLPRQPSLPRAKKMVPGKQLLRTKNPFHYLSGSIAAAQKRRSKRMTQ